MRLATKAALALAMITAPGWRPCARRRRSLTRRVVLPASRSTLFPGTVGQAFGIDFFPVGGAALYTWALAAGQLPPRMHLQTFPDPRDANNEMTGTPITAGTFSWTMRVIDYLGQQATQQFTITTIPECT